MDFYVPQTMQRAKRWILWRLEDGKKKPYSANYDGLASTTKSNTWSSYEKALNKYEYSNYNGLGFVFVEGDGLIFIDLDHCITSEGKLTDFAKEILDIFKNTYAEYSQSGNGIHIVCKGTIPRAYRKDEIGLEIYSNGRYMAFTGNAYTATEPQNYQTTIDELFKKFNITATNAQKPYEVMLPTATDSDIIKRAKSGGNSKEFSDLYYKGVYLYKKSDGTPDQSRADLRLISLLVYYAATDEQIHRLFSNSVLGQRNKATSDYIQRTINKAREHTKPIIKQNTSVYGYIRNNLTDTKAQQKKIKRY